MERRLAAILAADVVGYSRLVRADEEGTLQALQTLRAELIDPTIAAHNGRIVKLMGDGILVEFASVVDAVRTAASVQQAIAARNGDVPEDRRLVLRIGVNLGDVVIDGADIQGDGVNVAARLEGLAEPGGICISDGVHEQVRDRLDHAFEDMGAQTVKNIDRPVRAWRWTAEGSAAAPEPGASADAGVSDKPSIAVLPFDNMSGDAEQGYFADGISEDIITDLSKVSGLFVIARNSSFAYRGKSPDIRNVCRELGVRYVLEGSVRRAGDRVRINAQLIEGTGGGHVWADRFDRDLADIFAVQDEVTREIVGALKVALTAGEETQREGRRKVDPEAYDLYVRARAHLFRFTPEANLECRASLEKALARDPTLAAAQAMIALSLATDYFNGWNGSSLETMTTARRIAEDAVRSDPTEVQAYHAIALTRMWSGNLDKALEAAEKALELNPNFAGGVVALGQARDFAGDHRGAIEAAEKALALDPHYDIGMQLLGRAQFGLEQDDDALKSFEQRLALNPNSDMSRAFLTAIHGLAGRQDEARQNLEKLRAVNPSFSVEALRKIYPYKSPAVMDRLADGLAKAGFTE